MRFGEREVFDSGRAGQKPKDGSPAPACWEQKNEIGRRRISRIQDLFAPAKGQQIVIALHDAGRS